MHPFAPAAHHERRLTQLLQRFFGDLEPAATVLLREKLRWIELAGGEKLMEQGDPGDSMYLSVSGRLRAYLRQDDGAHRMVREMARGEVIGEMSLFADEPRSATVVAVRDSVLVRLDKADFEPFMRSGAQVPLALTRLIIRRLNTQHAPARYAAPVTMGLFPVTDGIDLPAFAARLAKDLSKGGRVRIIDRQAIDIQAMPGETTAVDRSARIALVLAEIESDHDFVLLLSDGEPSEWTTLCGRHSDERLLLADATQPAQLHAIETECLAGHAARSEAAEILVLLHAADVHAPRGTAAWLARRPVAEHFHIRPEVPADMARLARLQSRTAIGLVFAGGGARGFAHLGVLRALQERGVAVDCIGGTSMGALMAALAASDQPLQRVLEVTRSAFKVNPTGDFNLLPLISLIRGRRLRETSRRAVETLMGFDADIEDLWKSFFCIATNYSQAREQTLAHGPLRLALQASSAIPGALPPVVLGGDLLCDGGTFNNFPVDVMRARRGIGCVIGVDLSSRKVRRLDFDDVPGPWTLLLDRLRPRASRRYRLPSLAAYLLNVTILYSASRQSAARHQTDVHLNPPLDHVGLLEWRSLDRVVQLGYEHAMQVLDDPAVAATLAHAGILDATGAVRQEQGIGA